MSGPRPPVDLSLVVPVYNECDSLPVLVEEVARALAGRSYEIVAVDDGSTDGSLDVLKALKRDHPELHIVAFAANAGQTAAFAAGFRAARGRVAVTLDADLQNDPADIPALLSELERDRKSTRLNSSHGYISYAVFCLKKKKKSMSRG